MDAIPYARCLPAGEGPSCWGRAGGGSSVQCSAVLCCTILTSTAEACPACLPACPAWRETSADTLQDVLFLSDTHLHHHIHHHIPHHIHHHDPSHTHLPCPPCPLSPVTHHPSPVTHHPQPPIHHPQPPIHHPSLQTRPPWSKAEGGLREAHGSTRNVRPPLIHPSLASLARRVCRRGGRGTMQYVPAAVRRAPALA